MWLISASVHWFTGDIADAAAAGLQRAAAADDAQGAVYSIDARDELGLHPLLHAALREADTGWGVHPEQRYPGHRGTRRRSEGPRCDVVLTPRGRPLVDPLRAGTLFDAGDAAEVEEAYWLEVKSVAQFESDGPFRRYSAELLGTVTRDVKKLAGDEAIRHAGLLLVLFTADQATAEHDLGVWHDRCLRKALPASAPAMRGFPLRDRLGNGWCAVAVFGVKG